MRQKTVRIIVISAFAILFIISAFNLAKILIDYQKNDRFYQTLQNKVVTSSPITTLPDKPYQSALSIDFDALCKENADIIGWIYCPDTPINYPVVQGKNNEQYIRADLYGNYLAGGTIFADCRNSEIEQDENLIIYGHNMNNNSMFASLTNYKKQSYFDSHPKLYLYTPLADYEIECAYGATIKADHDIYRLHPDTETLHNLQQSSTFVSPVTLQESDKLITLSTCSYDYNDARYVLVGKLTKIS